MTRVFCLIAIQILTASISAQEINEVDRLDLGVIVVIDNSVVGSVTISKDALARKTGGVAFISTGQPGYFQLSDFEANRRLYIDVIKVQTTTTTTFVSAEQFTIKEYEHLEYVQTDANGYAELYIGATFETSGSGSRNFRDTDFSASYRIEINY